jgi:hypothetical protein
MKVSVLIKTKTTVRSRLARDPTSSIYAAMSAWLKLSSSCSPVLLADQDTSVKSVTSMRRRARRLKGKA